MRRVFLGENGYVLRNSNILNEMYSLVGRTKVLPKEKEVELLQEMANCVESRKAVIENVLLKANLKIVWSIATRYKGMMAFEDIFQNACVGALVAIRTFDLDKGTCLTTHILQMVQKYVCESLTNESRTVRLGAHQIKCDYRQVSFDAPIGDDGENDCTMYNFFPSQSRADNLTEQSDKLTAIRQMLNGLSRVEKDVVCSLFGIGKTEETQYMISQRLHLTEERIRQIKVSALEKMRNYRK